MRPRGIREEEGNAYLYARVKGDTEWRASGLWKNVITTA